MPEQGGPSADASTQRGGRRAARLAAVQALYQIDVAGTRTDRILSEFVDHRFSDAAGGYRRPDTGLFADIVRGVTARTEEFDDMIRPVLTADWSIERLDRVLFAILRAGAYEIVGREDVPARVVISEYVDVAKAFFNGREPAMVNGILDRLAHLLRPDEMAENGGNGAPSE